jgi:hypothetical protein
MLHSCCFVALDCGGDSTDDQCAVQRCEMLWVFLRASAVARCSAVCSLGDGFVICCWRVAGPQRCGSDQILINACIKRCESWW